MTGAITENKSGIPSGLNTIVHIKIKARVLKYSIKYKVDPSAGNPPE